MSITAQNFLGDQNSPRLRSTQLLQTSLACWSHHTCLRSLVHPWSELVGRELCSMNPLHDGGELFLCSALRSYIQAEQTRTQQSPFSNWKKKKNHQASSAGGFIVISELFQLLHSQPRRIQQPLPSPAHRTECCRAHTVLAVCASQRTWSSQPSAHTWPQVLHRWVHKFHCFSGMWNSNTTPTPKAYPL